MEVDNLNINKIFPEDDEKKKKGLSGFLEKRGFVVVLAICILIIGASAAYIIMDGFSGPNFGMDDKLIPDASPDKSTMNDDSTESSANDSDKLSPSSSPFEALQNNAKTPAPSPSATPKATPHQSKAQERATLKQNLMMPVFGPISFEFAEKRLVYSKTLEEWRTHSGVDIGADKGTLVKAAADGIVCDIKNDPRFGATVIIDHGSGYKTVYSNLTAIDMVAVNQKVKQGENIGSVGNTAIFESAEQAHLHFEVLANGEPVDPAKLLPKLN